jgi:hypothetical protein
MAEWARNGDSEARVWMMVGVLVRVALQMGYHRFAFTSLSDSMSDPRHRDPSQYPEITIFQGEIRRRVWCFVQGLDTLTSVLVGLPSMIRTLDSDTRAPRNLHDWEVTESMTSLPESRPEEEETPVSYMLAKRKIVTVAGDIVSLLGSLSQPSYEQVLKLDDELVQAYQDLPAHLKVESTEKMLSEAPSRVNQRIQLAFLYNQSSCILHRKFLARGRTDPHFSRSYQRCMESALNLLEHQQYLYTETKVKGSIKPRHWYRVAHTSHDFILAAMIVCLNLKYKKLEEQSGRILNLESQQAKIWQSLEFACNLWMEEKDSSPEAAKVYQVLSQVLGTHAMEENAGIVQSHMVQPATQTNPELPLFASNQWLGVPEVNMDIDWVSGLNFTDITLCFDS